MKCSKCQTDNPDTQSFCGDCGTQLGPQKGIPAHTETIETTSAHLSKGTCIVDRYEIVAELGSGGMGEVYLAEDTNLERQVAIKVLPPQFALDKERLARFQREARLLASLSHPNIATIHGLEKSDDLQILVMELVEGETLTEMIKKEPLPIEEALQICRQIAEGLEFAHETGIIHRDLKPANIMVTPRDKVKILDFGIAKAFQDKHSESDPSKSPAITDEMTRPGVILGTAAYMSPEQAKGKEVDKRADIWAFGCILYECLAGKRLFVGETISEILASILKDEPDWRSLPNTTPLKIRELVSRCLVKNARDRLHDIADARIEIEEILLLESKEFDKVFEMPVGAKRWRRFLPWVLSGFMVALAALGFWSPWRSANTHSSPLTRFIINLPADSTLDPSIRPAVAFSPRDTSLVYVSVQESGSRLYIRSMEKYEPTPLDGTEGASGPFFSHDGDWIGFFAEGKLKKISINGGAPEILCDAALGRGACWGPDNTIIFTAAPGTGLWRVDASGGKPKILTYLDLERRELTHRWPDYLPDGKSVLFTIRTANDTTFDGASIALLDLENGEHHILIEGGTQARYVPTGHLVFARAGSLHTVPFDKNSHQVSGTPVPVLEKVMMNPSTGAAQFSFSEDGSLVYVKGDLWRAERTLLSMEREGEMQPLTMQRHPFQSPRLSSDGDRIAFMVEAANDDIWILNIASDNITRLTFEAGANVAPIWTPDDSRITFSSNRSGPYNIFWRPVDGSSPAEQLTDSDYIDFANSWSPDGTTLIYTQNHPSTGLDLRLLEGEGNNREFLVTPYNEFAAAFSPDGKWIAYVSDESGQNEVYVSPYPGPGGKWAISTQGGSFPIWAADGRVLFYLAGARMMEASIPTTQGFQAAARREIFEVTFLSSGANPSIPNYDVSSDGSWFVMIRTERKQSPSQIHVIRNWFEELKRLVSTGK